MVRNLASVDSFVAPCKGFRNPYFALPDRGLRIVDSSSNGPPILDLMNSTLRAVLIGKDVSVNDAATLAAIQGQDGSKVWQGITAIVCHPTLSVTFVRKYNGSVTAYVSKMGKEDATLY